jgi:hypothetical protein
MDTKELQRNSTNCCSASQTFDQPCIRESYVCGTSIAIFLAFSDMGLCVYIHNTKLALRRKELFAMTLCTYFILLSCQPWLSRISHTSFFRFSSL